MGTKKATEETCAFQNAQKRLAARFDLERTDGTRHGTTLP